MDHLMDEGTRFHLLMLAHVVAFACVLGVFFMLLFDNIQILYVLFGLALLSLFIIPFLGDPKKNVLSIGPIWMKGRTRP